VDVAVSPGHALIIPRRLVATWFEATREEQIALFELIDTVKARLDAELQPDGYNIGINAGAAAGLERSCTQAELPCLGASPKRRPGCDRRGAGGVGRRRFAIRILRAVGRAGGGLSGYE
jgi:hypothetical protein